MGLIVLWLLLCMRPAMAAIEVHEFESDADLARYQKFISELRCPKCKNNNLAGTNSQIAEDLRRELHRMIEAGMTDKEITNFMASSYGDFVFYRPRFTAGNVALFVIPVALLGLGFYVLMGIVKRRRADAQLPPHELSAEQREELDRILR